MFLTISGIYILLSAFCLLMVSPTVRPYAREVRVLTGRKRPRKN